MLAALLIAAAVVVAITAVIGILVWFALTNGASRQYTTMSNYRTQLRHIERDTQRQMRQLARDCERAAIDVLERRSPYE